MAEGGGPFWGVRDRGALVPVTGLCSPKVMPWPPYKIGHVAQEGL